MPMQAGEFWRADIPFTHGSASKVRPVLILWLDLDCLERSLLFRRPGAVGVADAQLLKTTWSLSIKPQF